MSDPLAARLRPGVAEELRAALAAYDADPIPGRTLAVIGVARALLICLDAERESTAATSGMGDERPCPHGTPPGRYCQVCDESTDLIARPRSCPTCHGICNGAFGCPDPWHQQ